MSTFFRNLLENSRIWLELLCPAPEEQRAVRAPEAE